MPTPPRPTSRSTSKRPPMGERWPRGRVVIVLYGTCGGADPPPSSLVTRGFLADGLRDANGHPLPSLGSCSKRATMILLAMALPQEFHEAFENLLEIVGKGDNMPIARLIPIIGLFTWPAL